MNLKEILKKVIVTAIVIGLAAFITPGWQVGGITTALLAGAFIGLVNYIIEMFADGSRPTQGFIGFVVTFIILKLTANFVDGFNISTLGAIIGAIIVGLVDALIPGGYI